MSLRQRVCSTLTPSSRAGLKRSVNLCCDGLYSIQPRMDGSGFIIGLSRSISLRAGYEGLRDKGMPGSELFRLLFAKVLWG